MFGEELKKYRSAVGLSQKALAELLNVSQQAVGSWETNRTSPSPETIADIANVLGVSADCLLGVTEKKTPPQSDEAFEPELTEKDELDISRRLDAMLSDLDKNNSALMFDGEPLDDESRELLISSLENSIRMAKIINKRKYTPKKYRKASDDRNSDTPEG